MSYRPATPIYREFCMDCTINIPGDETVKTSE